MLLIGASISMAGMPRGGRFMDKVGGGPYDNRVPIGPSDRPAVVPGRDGRGRETMPREDGGGEREKAQPEWSRGRERLLLLTLAAVQFTSIVDFMIVMPLGPELTEKLGINAGQFSYVVASYTYAAGVAGIAASAFLDRFDRKATFLTLYIGFILGTLLCGLENSYSGLLAARIVTGGFGGILGGQSLAIIGDVFPDHRRGQATGILMSAFALASVVGVPVGIVLGNSFGWQTPFLILAGLSLPPLILAGTTLPPLRSHLGRSQTPALARLRETFTHPNHLRAFTLIVVLMFGSFAVIPFISTFYVANVGLSKEQLPIVFVAAGLTTLIGSPIIGRLADRFGKLRTYQVMAPLTALLMLVVTHLGPVGVVWAATTSSLMMLTNSGRMVAAMAMVTGSVERRLRGGFMSANSAVQHVATGLGSTVGGLIVDYKEGGPFLHYERVGYIAAAATLASIWLAGRLRLADGEQPAPISIEESLAAAAEAEVDASEPIASLELGPS